MNSLGVYFGPGLISLIETKGKKILNSFGISRLNISSDEQEEKVPDELKIVALFKDELRKNNISTDKVAVTLAGKDLIIRTFEMPVLPHDELQASVNFEAKKYIPFKIEELVLSYQIFYDKASKKNLVLLVGIKKEILDKYLSIFEQLEQKMVALEYSAFSILRFLKLARAKTSGIVAAISIDIAERDEVNFTVLQNGFPLFSRDIILTDEALAETSEAKQSDPVQMLEKLKAELRISLDFYRRKFPTKNINRAVILAPEEHHSELDAFVKERELPCQFIDYKKYTGKPMAYSLSTFKAYGCSLVKTINTGIKIDLLGAKDKEKSRVAKELAESVVKGINLAELPKIDFKIVALSLLICLFTFIYGLYQRLPLQKELNNIINQRPKVSGVSPSASYTELSGLSATYKEKLDAINNLVIKQLYLTEELDTLPRLLPEGMWLTNMNFVKKDEDNSIELSLTGLVSLGDSDQEYKKVVSFYTSLKQDPHFKKNFKNFNLVSVERVDSDKNQVTRFVISCTY